MKLSHLAETLIGSEIVKIGGEIREKMRQGQKVYNFTIGDFDPAIFPIPKEMEEEIIEAYRLHFTNYPSAEGNPDLRDAISRFMQERQGLSYKPEEIQVSCGGRPLIYAVFRAICDKGDKVIIRTKPTITIRDYQVNMALTVDRPSSPTVTLTIDQAKYFNLALDDIMDIQSDINLLSIWSEDAAILH